MGICCVTHLECLSDFPTLSFHLQGSNRRGSQGFCSPAGTNCTYLQHAACHTTPVCCPAAAASFSAAMAAATPLAAPNTDVPATSTLAPAAAARRAVSGLMPPSTCTQAPHHHAHTPVQEKDIAATYMHTCSNPLRISHLPWPWRRLCPCSSWALVGRYCSSNKGTQLELPKCDS